MARKPDNWMPLYVGRYLQDTTRLTREQHGAYLLLIMDSWINGPAPDDDRVLAPIVKASSVEWRKLRPVMQPYFTIQDGKWVHGKVERERERASDLIEKRRLAGAAGGIAARGKSGRKKNGGDDTEEIPNEIPNGIANGAANDLQNNTPEPLPQPLPSGDSSLRSEGAIVAPVPGKALIPEWIPIEPWKGFVEMRKRIRAPLAGRAIVLTIKKLSDLRLAGENIGAVLDQSVERGWRSVFPVKRDDGGRNGNRGSSGKTDLQVRLGAVLSAADEMDRANDPEPTPDEGDEGSDIGDLLARTGEGIDCCDEGRTAAAVAPRMGSDVRHAPIALPRPEPDRKAGEIEVSDLHGRPRRHTGAVYSRGLAALSAGTEPRRETEILPPSLADTGHV